MCQKFLKEKCMVTNAFVKASSCVLHKASNTGIILIILDTTAITINQLIKQSVEIKLELIWRATNTNLFPIRATQNHQCC